MALRIALAVVVFVGLALLLRRLFVAGRRAERTDLRGRTFVVTGVGVGSIGFATARQLASMGAHVVGSVRAKPEAALAALASGLPEDARARLEVLPLDLVDRASVDRFADAVLARHPEGVDVLVNNAGIHLDLLRRWKEPRRSADGHEIHYRTNYVGTMQLTSRLLPALRERAAKTGDARVVFVTSHLHRLATNEEIFAEVSPYDSWRAYGRSKLAIVHVARELDRRHGAEGLHAYSLHPGSVYSRVADKGLEESPTSAIVRRIFAPVEAFILKSIDEGAQTSVHCATASGLPGGGYFEDCRPKAPSAQTDDAAVGARLLDEAIGLVDAEREPT